MAERMNRTEIPNEGIETPSGRLYPPPKHGSQIIFFIAAFFIAIVLGWIVSESAGNISELASGVIYFTYIIILFSGYAVWAGIAGSIAFRTIKVPLFKILFRFIIHKQKPASIEELFPTQEEAANIMVKVQKAARSFFILSVPVGLAGGFLSLFFNKEISSVFLFVIITATSASYGYFLFYYGRRGYMPFPED